MILDSAESSNAKLPARGVDEALSRAALPQPVAALIRDVVLRTRLWRREKIELAEELAAHFHDGLSSGRSMEQLCEAFGDPSRAAALIRRAKKRNRSRLWRAWTRAWQGIGVFFAAMLTIYVFLFVRYVTGEPSITRDFIAEINQPALAVPESQRAWPLYREALLAMPKLRELAKRADPIVVDGEGWEEVALALQVESAALKQLSLAAARPAFGYIVGKLPAPEDEPIFPGLADSIDELRNTFDLLAVVMPYLNELRRGASLPLMWDAHYAAAQGNGKRAARDITAMLGVAEHLTQPRTLISELVSYAMMARAFETLGEILAEHPHVIDGASLRDLAHRITAFHGGGALSISLEVEEMFFKDFIQHAFTDDGSGDGRLTRKGLQIMDGIVDPPPFDFGDLTMPVVGSVVAGRGELMREHERIMGLMAQEFATPLWELERRPADEAIQVIYGDPIARWRYFPITFLTPATSHAHILAEQATQRRDAILVAIALELYRRDHGNWPASLEELVPRHLPDVPPDRFDGKPLKYRIVAGTPVVYSVGTDRDDDGGGAPIEHDPSRWLSAAAVEQIKTGKFPSTPLADGDWILWPPESSEMADSLRRSAR